MTTAPIYDNLKNKDGIIYENHKIVKFAYNDEGDNGFALLNMQSKKIISWSLSGITEFKKMQEMKDKQKEELDLDQIIFNTQNEKKGGFYDLENEKICRHPDHTPPSHLYIPFGKGYKHVCPSCNKVFNITPLQITL